MIKSMTGYGIAESKFKQGRILVEIKSLNHKAMDINVRGNLGDPEIEYRIRNIVRENLFRGRVEVNLLIERVDTACFEINIPLLKRYYEALCRIRDELGIGGEINIGNLLSFKDIIIYKENYKKSNRFLKKIEGTLMEAIKSLDEMRLYEGRLIYKEFKKRLRRLGSLVDKLEKQRERIKEFYLNRFTQRIGEINLEVDGNRFMREVLIYAEKSDISEEISRLRGHIDNFNKIMDMEGPHGKKLEFLLQEMNREINTIGAKGVDVSNLVIDVKNELERMREQVQNIE